jgi:hypothetical protein
MSNIPFNPAHRKGHISELQTTSTRAFTMPWHERPNLTVEMAADVLGCSRAQVYKLARTGSISMVQNPATGRTLVTTTSVLEVVLLAQPFTPQGKNPKGAALTRRRQRDAVASTVTGQTAPQSTGRKAS